MKTTFSVETTTKLDWHEKIKKFVRDSIIEIQKKTPEIATERIRIYFPQYLVESFTKSLNTPIRELSGLYGVSVLPSFDNNITVASIDTPWNDQLPVCVFGLEELVIKKVIKHDLQSKFVYSMSNNKMSAIVIADNETTAKEIFMKKLNSIVFNDIIVTGDSEISEVSINCVGEAARQQENGIIMQSNY